MHSKNFNNYKIKKLTKDDIPQIQTLCEKCPDYYILDEGTVADENAALDIINALPPNKTFEDQYNLGIYDESNELSALVNIIDSYPDDGTWMLGLMLVDPNKRKIGLGRYFHQEIIKFAKERNGKEIRIAVLEDNIVALKFWKSLGYQFEKESTSDRGNNRVKTIFVYNLDLK